MKRIILPLLIVCIAACQNKKVELVERIKETNDLITANRKLADSMTRFYGNHFSEYPVPIMKAKYDSLDKSWLALLGQKDSLELELKKY
jgi:CO dehydrogenase/acetyl-CoA synthase epsilon subunit